MGGSYISIGVTPGTSSGDLGSHSSGGQVEGLETVFEKTGNITVRKRSFGRTTEETGEGVNQRKEKTKTSLDDIL